MSFSKAFEETQKKKMAGLYDIISAIFSSKVSGTVKIYAKMGALILLIIFLMCFQAYKKLV